MTTQELVDLKKRIEGFKQKQSELKGKRKQLLETLQTTFGCKTIAEAEKRAEALQKQIDKLEQEKEEAIKQIEDTYEF
jgi:hypothetical protein